MMESARPHDESEQGPSTMGLMFAFFAAILLVASGLIIFTYALFGQTKTTDILFDIRPGVWRVLMLGGGLGLVLAGANLFVGKMWARAVGLFMAVLSLIGGILNLEAYTVFAIGLIVLNLGIIYALGFRWHDIEEIAA